MILSLKSGIENMKEMNLSMRQTHRHKHQTCGYQWCGGGEVDWEFGFNRCKLLYIEWINSKVLLYSMGSYI